MSKLQIEYISILQIAPYVKNARTHSEEQISQIVESIREFGFTNPILIDQHNELIAGHGRLEAAKIVGLETVPAVRLSDLTEQQVKALRIVDNQLALNAGWDLDLLAAEIVELEADDFNLDLLGFDDDFLAGLLPDEMEIDPDRDQTDPEINDAQEKVSIILAPYEISVQRAEWDKWETSIRAKVGFDKSDVISEIKKRLKM
ncbi:DNA modification methylase [Vibrio phage phi 2]|uniref:ParB-like partition nuclease n=1 Tax=Vibrio phage X29 TaxID=1500713 RepID=UPI00045FDA63|nr:ParB-like partition nuclease [Vibrio phage X29]AHN84811.1 DNA modification methylase [Vibrio phage phi 2]AIA10348.1 DNA modification methylase [Vibrio phage X29]